MGRWQGWWGGTPCPAPDLPSPSEALLGSCGTQALRAWPCVTSTPAGPANGVQPLDWAPATGSTQERARGLGAAPLVGAVCPCSNPPSPGTGPSSPGSPAAVETKEGPLDSGNLGIQMGERPASWRHTPGRLTRGLWSAPHPLNDLQVGGGSQTLASGPCPPCPAPVWTRRTCQLKSIFAVWFKMALMNTTDRPKDRLRCVPGSRTSFSEKLHLF